MKRSCKSHRVQLGGQAMMTVLNNPHSINEDVIQEPRVVGQGVVESEETSGMRKL